MLRFKEIANYPLLAANAFAPDGSLLADAPSLAGYYGAYVVKTLK